MTRTHLGSTDAAVILGCSPWRSAHDLWRSLRGAPEVAPSPAMLRGLACEPYLARRVAALLGAEFTPVEPVTHPRGIPFLRVSGDYAAGRRGVELKTSGFYAHDRWSGLPDYYAVQCVLEAMAFGWDDVIVPALVLPAWVGDAEKATLAMTPAARLAAIHALAPIIVEASEVQVYRVERDDDYAEAIVRLMGAWWQKHIVDGEEPALVATDAWHDYARTVLVEREPLRSATEAEVALMLEYAEARAAAKAASQRQDDVAARVRHAIGVAAGLKSDAGTAVARSQKPSTNWRAAATELQTRLALLGEDPSDTIERHTKPSEGRTIDVRIRARRGEE